MMATLAGPANATVYSFDFNLASQGLDVSGQMTVNSLDEITAISGKITGSVNQTITGIVTDPNGTGAATSPDGQFIYDNLYYSGQNPVFDVDGLLFTTAQYPGGYWNLWGNSANNYSLYESTPGQGYPVQATTGGVVATVNPVPEASTWAMFFVGFAGLCYASLRRSGNRIGRGIALSSELEPSSLDGRAVPILSTRDDLERVLPVINARQG